MIVYKIFGIVLAIAGFLILKFFPDITSYQTNSFTMAGIFIGVLFILAGAGLIIFG